MAPSPSRSSRKDANALPSMSSTFWAIMILASLLIAYCSQLAAGTCEIVTLDRDSSQPRRTIARQTARCACKKGQIAGTTRARPACVDARIIKTKQWCEMLPCLEGEGCDLLINKSGWTCTQPGGRIKTTTKDALAQAQPTHKPCTDCEIFVSISKTEDILYCIDYSISYDLVQVLSSQHAVLTKLH
ncbi:chemokine-like protein TAFA-5 isoform X2 [Patagioenas fasciata]|uniref:chemokine-like protein TAFA-5 isoform X2 n=1 Tax=Patagioenas fasciata TaxID=372321 RepID=UPI003A9900F2